MKKILAMLLAGCMMFSLAACGETETVSVKEDVSKEEYIQNIIDDMDAAEKAIEGKEGFDFIVEETDGHFNSYGELTSEVIATSW